MHTSLLSMAFAAVLVEQKEVRGMRVHAQTQLNGSTQTFEADVASSAGAYAPGVHQAGIQKAWEGIMADPVQAIIVAFPGKMLDDDNEWSNDKLQDVAKKVKALLHSTVGNGGENGLLQMMEGVAEPDKIACPGDIFMPGTMISSTAASAIDKLVHAKALEKYKTAMSPCRKASQVYHGSPLPLVWDDSIPQTKGRAVMNNLQWRNGIVQVMSHQFLHAILTPSIYDGARKLGNAMHTLSDTFSDSHVQRQNLDFAFYPMDNRFDYIRQACPAYRVAKKFFVEELVKKSLADRKYCECAFVNMALSMDVSNMVYHVPPDFAKDYLWECSVKFEVASIARWARARLELQGGSDDERLGKANNYAKDFIDQVLCPSLQFYPLGNSVPDLPAGGAPKQYSWEELGVYPSAVINPSDASKIVRKWNDELTADRDKALSVSKPEVYPHEIYLSEKSFDICRTGVYTGALLTPEAYFEIVGGEVRNYIIPKGRIPQR